MNNYEIVRKIGFGAFGSVFLALDTTTQKNVTIKTCDPAVSHAIEQEMTILSLLNHPNIVKFIFKIDGPFSGIQEPHYEKLMVAEFVDGKDIFGYIESHKRTPQLTIKKCIIDISEALIYLENAGIIHRDIKPENIMEYSNGFKLIDFGLSVDIYNQDLKENEVPILVGTPMYFAPELIDHKYSFSSDLWAFGVTIYNLVTKRHPFDANTMAGLQNRLKILNYEATSQPKYDCLFQGIFISEPSIRFNARDLQEYATRVF